MWSYLGRVSGRDRRLWQSSQWRELVHPLHSTLILYDHSQLRWNLDLDLHLRFREVVRLVVDAHCSRLVVKYFRTMIGLAVRVCQGLSNTKFHFHLTIWQLTQSIIPFYSFVNFLLKLNSTLTPPLDLCLINLASINSSHSIQQTLIPIRHRVTVHLYSSPRLSFHPRIDPWFSINHFSK